jgi:tetratricopeptide (TPR) repeat protein
MSFPFHACARAVALCFVLALSGGAYGHPQPRASAAPAGAAPPASDFAQVRQLSESGKHDEALAQLRELQTKNPGLKGLDHEFGVVYYKKGDYLAAVSSLKKALAADPSDNEATQLLGLSSYLAGRPAEAVLYLERVQSWYPRANVDAAYILGVCYIQTKDYAKARMAFARMFDVPAARMLLRQEFDPVAEEYAQKAATLDPKLPGAHLLLGELYLYKSRVPEAIEQFQKELSLNPSNATAYYKLADAYSRIQKFDDAERLLQRSLWLDATSTGPYILMGKVLEKKGEFELAVRALRRAVTMDPNNPITHHLLGQTYRDMGKEDEAARELKIAEELLVKQDAHP